MEGRAKPQSWWHTLPGVLTGLAGVITALGALVLAINTSGFLKKEDASTGTEMCQHDTVEARDYVQVENAGVLDVARGFYPLVGTTAEDGKGPSSVTYSIDLPHPCTFSLRVHYAIPAGIEPRPTHIVWNGEVIARNALTQPRDGFLPRNAVGQDVGLVATRKEKNQLRLFTESPIALPHLLRFEFLPRQ